MLLMAAFKPPRFAQDHELDDLLGRRASGTKAARHAAPLAVPPAADAKDDRWQPFAVAMMRGLSRQTCCAGRRIPATVAWETIFSAYNQDDVDAFNQALANYRGELGRTRPRM